jgi:hypothetical protein
MGSGMCWSIRSSDTPVAGVNVLKGDKNVPSPYLLSGTGFIHEFPKYHPIPGHLVALMLHPHASNHGG